MTHTLAFDIGGTKIAYGVVSDETPQQAQFCGTVPAQPAGSTLARQFDIALRQALADARAADVEPTRVGAGAPGVVRGPAGTILRAGPTVPGWQGTVLEDIIRPHLDVPMAIHNDVRIWAYGEHALGVGQQLAEAQGRVLYLSLGTGVGGAVMEAGKLMGGNRGTAGEFSELLAVDCRGQADRVENIAAGNSLSRYYNALRHDPEVGRIAWDHPVRPDDMDLYQVMERYNAGDELARQVISGNMAGLGRALAGLVAGFDIDAIVLGGGVIGIGAPVLDPLRQGFKETVLETHSDIPIVTSALGGQAPLVGAAAYARDWS